MIVGIVGSRNWNDYNLFSVYLKAYKSLFPIEMIVSGGCKGVDDMAYRYSIEHGITFVCHSPIPSDGEAKYRRRNLRIVAHVEVILAFPMGRSVGTRHSISLCKKLKKPFYIIEITQ